MDLQSDHDRYRLPATRIERDSMGEMEVPADALYGASTQRAVLNFPISGQPMPRRFLRALALIKLRRPRPTRSSACSTPMSPMRPRPPPLRSPTAIKDDQFPNDIRQTAEDPTNANMNEVIAQSATARLGGDRVVH